MNPPFELSATKWKVLVVEDVPDQLETIVDSLKELGDFFEVEACQTVSAAKILLENRRADPFHVVLADMKIDGPESGLEVIRAARSIDIYTEIIVMTHYATLDNVYAAIQIGANQYLSKSLPNFLPTLLTVVQERVLRAHVYRGTSDYFAQVENVFSQLRESLEKIKAMPGDATVEAIRPAIDAVLLKIERML